MQDLRDLYDRLPSKNAYLFGSSVVFCGASLLMIINSLSFESKAFSQQSEMSEISVDWATQPLVDITATTDHECPGDSELIFYKPWLGTKLWCVCLYPHTNDRLTKYRHYEGECLETRANDYNGECMQLEALQPVLMGQI